MIDSEMAAEESAAGREAEPIMTPEQARRAVDLLIRLWWSQQEPEC